MKRIILAFPFIFVFANAFSAVHQNTAIAKCIQKTGINETTVAHIGTTLEIPDTIVTKKFLMCLNKKMGFQDEDGQMLFDNLREDLELTDGEVSATISTCKQVRGNNSVENSYLATKCVFRKIKSILKIKMKR